jgi:tRNA nucleotidyltransferase (CCA-adding enzyme)
MQLLPRKGKTVAPETIELCKSMFEEYGSLAKERVFEEWIKLLMKSNNPSRGLKFLADCDWIRHYPELDALRYTNQNLNWHPEGNVWEHNLMVVDNAARVKELVPKDWREAYMFGNLLHDVGKPKTTDEELNSKKHDQAGVPIAREFMGRITTETDLIEKTIAIVENHMGPGNLTRENAGENAWKRLHNAVPLNVIAYVSKADGLGRAGRSLEDYHGPSELALKYFEKYGQKPIPQILMGRDLLERGYYEGPLIGKIIKAAYDLQIDEGVTDKNILYEKAKQIVEAAKI